MGATNGKLWSQNFVSIIFSSTVSALGNALAGFGIGVMVLDYTGSTFLYTLFLVAVNMPKMIMPMLAGPYLDAFSRRKALLVLNSMSAATYLLMFLLLSAGLFSFPLFIALCLLAGSLNSVYLVAYDSLFPTLIAPGNFRKAYATASVLDTLSLMAAPLALFVYERVGSVEPLLIVDAVAFLLAALAVSRIKTDESHIKKEVQAFSARRYADDFREGVRYIKSEPGLLVITVFFFFTTMGFGFDSLATPYFKSVTHLGENPYIYVMAGMLSGRMLGGLLQYRHKIPSQRKFPIAIAAYVMVGIVQGVYLFMPHRWIMSALMFVSGIMSVTSSNIRVASTQTYVPNSHRARFNGTFIMIINTGAIVGQLMAGVLAEAMPIRTVYFGVMFAQLIAVYLTMVRHGRQVKPIYNVDI